MNNLYALSTGYIVFLMFFIIYEHACFNDEWYTLQYPQML